MTSELRSNKGFPVVLFHRDVHAVAGARRTEVSALNATALLLTTQGAQNLLIPVPDSHTRERVAQVLLVLPQSVRNLIKLVDENGSVLKRVDRHFAPLEDQVTSARKRKDGSASAEYLFVIEARELFYLLALASKAGAATIDAPLSQTRHLLHCINPLKFKGEAGHRLAQLSYLVTRYTPVITDHADVSTDLTKASVRSLLLEILDSADFSNVTQEMGRLGYLARPMTGLRRLRQAVLSLCQRPRFKAMLQGTLATSQLAGARLPTELLEASLQSAGLRADFGPPVLSLGPFEADVLKVALLEAGPSCKPAPVGKDEPLGKSHLGENPLSGHVYRPWLCGEFLCASNPTPYDAQERLVVERSCAQTAREAVLRLARSSET